MARYEKWSEDQKLRCQGPVNIIPRKSLKYKRSSQDHFNLRWKSQNFVMTEEYLLPKNHGLWLLHGSWCDWFSLFVLAMHLMLSHVPNFQGHTVCHIWYVTYRMLHTMHCPCMSMHCVEMVGVWSWKNKFCAGVRRDPLTVIKKWNQQECKNNTKKAKSSS